MDKNRGKVWGGKLLRDRTYAGSAALNSHARERDVIRPNDGRGAQDCAPLGDIFRIAVADVTDPGSDASGLQDPPVPPLTERRIQLTKVVRSRMIGEALAHAERNHCANSFSVT